MGVDVGMCGGVRVELACVGFLIWVLAWGNEGWVGVGGTMCVIFFRTE